MLQDVRYASEWCTLTVHLVFLKNSRRQKHADTSRFRYITRAYILLIWQHQVHLCHALRTLTNNLHSGKELHFYVVHKSAGTTVSTLYKLNILRRRVGMGGNSPVLSYPATYKATYNNIGYCTQRGSKLTKLCWLTLGPNTVFSFVSVQLLLVLLHHSHKLALPQQLQMGPEQITRIHRNLLLKNRSIFLFATSLDCEVLYRRQCCGSGFVCFWASRIRVH